MKDRIFDFATAIVPCRAPGQRRTTCARTQCRVLLALALGVPPYHLKAVHHFKPGIVYHARQRARAAGIVHSHL